MQVPSSTYASVTYSDTHTHALQIGQTAALTQLLHSGLCSVWFTVLCSLYNLILLSLILLMSATSNQELVTKWGFVHTKSRVSK